MAGRGGHGEDDREQEQRRRQREAQQGDYFAAGVAGALAIGAAGYAAYKYYGAQTSSEQAPAELYGARAQASAELYAMTSSKQAPPGWFDGFRNTLSSFWRNVEETQEDEEHAIEAAAVLQPEGIRYRNKYNKFDPWFQNLLRTVLRIDEGESLEFKKALLEILGVLLKGMQEADPLFKYLYREIAPAGSSWEDLKICKPDEFDLNLILFPIDVQENVKIEDTGCGHIAIRLDEGFDISGRKVLKKFQNDPRFSSHEASIKAQLKNWVENSYVSRSKVMSWMQGVVDLALYRLKAYEWDHVKCISRSMSGPAVTINVILKNGKQFSIDLVPAFEFNQGHLPPKMQTKLQDKLPGRLVRPWYAIPKGPSNSPSKMWRTSLYAAERDLMRGHNHLKPIIRIMKRLRDVKEWKGISSYYLKTMFMWMKDDENQLGKLGLGETVMLAMKRLNRALQDGEINYYWDDGLNLLQDRCNKEFLMNVSNYLTNIIKQFERCADGDTNVYPMKHFDCDENGYACSNVIVESLNHLLNRHASSSDDANCVLM